MKKLFRILDSSRNLLKYRTVRENISLMEETFRKYKIKQPVKNELDYYNACLIHQGILNKVAYEKIYEDNRYDLIDLWNTLDRNKKNFFVNKALDRYRPSMPYFVNGDDVFRMPMLEPLFNNLYEKELAIQELPQYLKFQNDFRNFIVDPFSEYFDLPYKSGFIKVDYVYSDDNNLALYEKTNSCLYLIDRERNIRRIGMKRGMERFSDIAFVRALLEGNSEELIEILKRTDYIEPKLMKKINRYYRKKK